MHMQTFNYVLAALAKNSESHLFVFNATVDYTAKY